MRPIRAAVILAAVLIPPRAADLKARPTSAAAFPQARPASAAARRIETLRTEPNGTFALADAPGGRERIQIFTAGGARIGGFTLPGRATPRVTLGAMVLNGIGTLQGLFFTADGRLLVTPGCYEFDVGR